MYRPDKEYIKANEEFHRFVNDDYITPYPKSQSDQYGKFNKKGDIINIRKSVVLKHQVRRHNAVSNCSRKSVSVRSSEGLHGRILQLVQASDSGLFNGVFADNDPLPWIVYLHSARSAGGGNLFVGGESFENCADVWTGYER